MLSRFGADVNDPWIQPVPDQNIYSSLLGRSESPIFKWIETLTSRCIAENVDTIVADSAEGYNPSHDLCRILANTLSSRLKEMGRPVLNLEFPLEGPPISASGQDRVHTQVNLSQQETREKIKLALNYAKCTSSTLYEEIKTMLQRYGENAFATEIIYAAQTTCYENGMLPRSPPHFEQVGSAKQKAGIYSDVIRAEHLLRISQEINARRK